MKKESNLRQFQVKKNSLFAAPLHALKFGYVRTSLEMISLASQCIFDFEIRKKQMFTEARAFSRVTYFLFSSEPAGFFLKLI